MRVDVLASPPLAARGALVTLGDNAFDEILLDSPVLSDVTRLAARAAIDSARKDARNFEFRSNVEGRSETFDLSSLSPASEFVDLVPTDEGVRESRDVVGVFPD